LPAEVHPEINSDSGTLKELRADAAGARGYLKKLKPIDRKSVV
jgi:hypothetical protein